MDDFELEMKKTFLEESESLLNEAESAFIALDAGEYNDEMMARIFRAAHSFKGGARAVGFLQLAEFGHKLEDAISLIKAGEVKPTKGVCTVLLESLDVLKIYVEGLKGDLGFQYDSSALEQRLKDIRQAQGVGVSSSSQV